VAFKPNGRRPHPNSPVMLYAGPTVPPYPRRLDPDTALMLNGRPNGAAATPPPTRHFPRDTPTELRDT
jgi:hypothetical protein